MFPTVTMLILYACKKPVGGGDFKLTAALGFLLGLTHFAAAYLLSGVMALVWAAVKKRKSVPLKVFFVSGGDVVVYYVCKIRNIRYKYGISARDLADEVRVSQQYISRLELGLEKPSSRNVRIIKNAVMLYYIRQERRLSLKKEIVAQQDHLMQLEEEQHGQNHRFY